MATHHHVCVCVCIVYVCGRRFKQILRARDANHAAEGRSGHGEAGAGTGTEAAGATLNAGEHMGRSPPPAAVPPPAAMPPPAAVPPPAAMPPPASKPASVPPGGADEEDKC